MENPFNTLKNIFTGSNNDQIENTFSTKDIGLATYLHYKGHHIKAIEVDARRKIGVFCFDKEFTKDDAQDYWRGAQVEAVRFHEMQLLLKKRMWHEINSYSSKYA